MLIGFTDVDIAYNDNDWSNKFFSTNQKSVKNYYNEVSNGKVQITPAPETYGTQNDGVVKVKLDYAHPSTSGKSMGTVITDALAKADSQVNFASLDTNNDQVVDSKDGFYIVSFLAGNEQASGGHFQTFGRISHMLLIQITMVLQYQACIQRRVKNNMVIWRQLVYLLMS